MSILQAAVLGLVQGLAEFLPISSSGHLILARMLMGISEEAAASGAYLMLDILLHVGTLIAVIIVFWHDWWDMILHLFRVKTLWLLFLASMPTLIVGLLLKDQIESLFTGWFLGASFLITALFLLLAEWISRRSEEKGKEEPGILHALVMGVMQAVALLPGVSRSGATLSGGLFSGLKRKSAAKFSFMMSAPAILGSLIFEGKDAMEQGYINELLPVPTIVGIAVAAISGYLAIRFMLGLIQRISLNWFALYVAIIGVVILALQLIRFPGIPAFELPIAQVIATVNV